jgi:cysteine synthase
MVKKEVPVPKGVTEQQVRLAKAFVQERYETGISIADFCRNNGISTKTWYEWMKDEVFESYLKALGGSIISDDERQAYQQVKKKIMEMATKPTASVREIELFLNTFSYIVDAEKQERMKELGIVPAHEKASEKTIEEKKMILLQRLKGDAE